MKGSPSRRPASLHPSTSPKERDWRLGAAQVSTFTRQLADLLDAGVPLMSGLSVLKQSAPPRSALTGLLGQINEHIAQGQPLSAALRRYPRTFDAVYLRLVQLGEASGQLADMLRQLAKSRDQSAQHREQWRQALTYPCFVGVVACGVIAALMLWAVPAFEQLFDGFGTPLPSLTRAVLGFSRTFAAAAPFIALGLALVVLILWRLGNRSREWQYRLDAFRQRLPAVGSLFNAHGFALWSGGLATLLRAGMPLLEALQLLGQSSQQPVFDHASRHLATRLRFGDRLADAMREHGAFPRVAVEIVAIAERTGSLDRMLADLSERTADDVQRRIKRAVSLAEPVTITVCGAFVAVLVMALYLPIIELGNVI